jgi:endonuclease YncB( thermonuclease family)
MGMLKVTGTLDTASIWPAGRSDADTVNLKIDVPSGGFSFRSGATGAFKKTKVFETSFVKVKFGKPKPPIRANGKITVRLQGIDSPELHFRPEALPNAASKAGKTITTAQRSAYKVLNKEYRQVQGESASDALHKLLTQPGIPAILPCTILTQVKLPGEPFDSYGRLVGDVIVPIGGKQINLNQWLCTNGWTLPAFYNSMTNAEITVLRNLCANAQKKNLGLWKYFSQTVSPFDFSLIYENPKKIAIDLTKDKGKFLIPKLFRRQTTYATRKKIGIVALNMTFKAWVQDLEADKKKGFIPLRAYLLQGKKGKRDFLANHLIGGKFDLQPDQMVFVEDDSFLLSAPTANAPHVTNWF